MIANYIIDEIYNLSSKIDYPDPSHHFDHVKRVVSNALYIQSKEGGNKSTILVSALLHDCVPIKKDDPNSKISSTLSAKNAETILKRYSLQDDVIKNVYHCIEAHSFSRRIKPITLEAKILQDADRIDALGAIGIARTFSVSGSINRIMYDSDDPFCEKRAINDKQYSLDHFYAKLLTIADHMQTQTGKIVAKERTLYLEQFLQQLRNEINFSAISANPTMQNGVLA
ncbi:MAG: HD domain-containing protein [Gammaproteobacteria bacterium]